VDRKYGERLSLRCYRKPEELDLIMKDTESIARKTWQRAVRVGFFDNDTTRQRYKAALGREQLYVYILYIDDKPVAFRHGLQYGNTYYAEITGMDPAYRNDRLGTILLLKVIEDLPEKHGIRILDFGTGGDEGGNAEHKRIFCNERFERANVCIYAPTIRSVMINATRSFLSLTKILSKRILDFLGLKEKVKRHWRQSALREEHGP
jgi:CelD/BcsL family acetyltransferase involved in cellulose biosynthesis